MAPLSTVRIRNTCKEQLKPTPAPERALATLLRRCRVLHNTALEQRLTGGWRRGQGRSPTRFQHEAELQDSRAAFSEDAAMPSHVLGRARLPRPHLSGALPSRACGGEGGVPRFQGGGVPLV